MPAKNSLSSLLKSDQREQVSLDLDAATFRAPRVEAGQYRVAAPRFAQDNSSLQLARALGQFAGPIAGQLVARKQGMDEEMVQFANMLTPEQSMAIASGDIEPIQSELDTMAERLDASERKGFLRFVENPNNYIRASKMMGVKIASGFEKDLIENFETYLRDPQYEGWEPEQILQTVREDLVAKNQLKGYAYEGFMSASEDVNNRFAVTMADRNAEILEQEHILSVVSTLGGLFENENEQGFNKAFVQLTAAMTPDKQAEIIKEIANGMTDDITLLEKFHGYLAGEDGLRLGQDAPVPEGLINSIGETIDRQKRDLELAHDRATAKSLDIYTSSTQVNMANIRSGQPLLPISFTLSSGEVVSLDPPKEISTEEEYLEWQLGEIRKLDPLKMTSAEKQTLIASTQKTYEDGLTAKTAFFSNNGTLKVREMIANVFGVSSEFTGEPLYMSSEELSSMQDNKEQELKTMLEEVYNDPALRDDQKKAKAERISREFITSLDIDLHSQRNQLNKDQVYARVAEEVGGGVTLEARMLSGLSRSSDVFGGTIPYTPEERTAAREWSEKTNLEVDGILSSDRSPDEKDLTEAQLMLKRRQDAYQHIQDAKVAYVEEIEKLDEVPEVNSLYSSEEKARLEKTRANQISKMNAQIEEQSYDQVVQGRVIGKVVLPSTKAKLQESFSGKPDQTVEFSRRRAVTVELQGETLSRKAQKYYSIVAAERLYNENTHPLSLEEIKSGTFDNQFTIGADVLSPIQHPIISPEVISGAEAIETNEALIREYVDALGLDSTDDEVVNKFITEQAELYHNKYGFPLILPEEANDNQEK